MLPSRLYAAMAEVDSQAPQGALVSLRDLRSHLGCPSGFDDAVLALADQGLVALHHTDGDPRWGTEGLVKDGDGWVIGIARR